MVPNVLDAFDDAALDALPFGAIALDAAGRIARYNQVEARRANVSRWMRIRGFLDGAAASAFRARGVTVTMRRRPSGGAWLIVEPQPYLATTIPNVIASC